jgi:hypothetical protein
MIHSRVSWMFLPVDRSITLSAPHRVAQTIFSTSSSMEEETAELPMFALILTRNFLPMIIGSDSGWLRLAGITARPRATSLRTSSTSTPSRTATNRISGVTMPALAQASWVAAPSTGSRASIQACLILGSPARRSMVAVSSVYGPEVSYTSKCSPLVSSTLRTGTRKASGPSTYTLCEPWIGPVVTLGVTVRSSSAVMAIPPYAGITRSGSYGRRHPSRPLSPMSYELP